MVDPLVNMFAAFWAVREKVLIVVSEKKNVQAQSHSLLIKVNSWMIAAFDRWINIDQTDLRRLTLIDIWPWPGTLIMVN